MNNFTKTETLPKSGHVNEVCKEWLVREDGALAYKLQSQEINEFYKGNRHRNAVVREDFPTALQEQIKEHESAQQQAEAYRRRLIEQEEHDKRVAKEIADKLERDIQEQQQQELLESEAIAKRMQEIYVNLPPAPPPVTRDKSKAPPPRPAKASSKQQNSIANEQHQQQQPSTSNALRYHKQFNPHHHSHQHQPQNQQQQQQFADTNGYKGLSVNLPTTPQRQKSHTNTNQLLVSGEGSSSSPSSSCSPSSPLRPQQQQQQQQQQYKPFNDNNNFNAQPQFRHGHSPTSALLTSTPPASSSSSSSSSATRRNNVFDFNNTSHSQQTPTHQITPSKHQIQNLLLHSPTSTTPTPQVTSNTLVEELIEYSDVADTIRRYDINTSTNSNAPINDDIDSPTKINRILSPSHENLLSSNEKNFQKLSPEKYDQIMGNGDLMAARQNSNRVTEQQMQEHADDIDVYVDPCDYESLKEIGLPMEEIKELSKKMKQEQKDELLARRLQELESNDGLSQEERDRMMAIEAQDKELAKMLQERERAKAKRAKEKARIRKSQQQKDSTCGSSSSSHCGPLLPLPQDCMSSSKQRLPVTSSPPYTTTQRYPQQQQQIPDDPMDLEAYSNPIDLITSQQRQPNGTLTNGSLTRDSTNSAGRYSASGGGGGGTGLHRDDDIYTLPVDSCRPTTNQRPVSLIIGPDTAAGQYNSMTRSENYSLDSHGSLNGHHEIPSRMNYSKSSLLDKSSSPTPPYMPIQGTRRSNSGEERKKKSKDKCTHQ